MADNEVNSFVQYGDGTYEYYCEAAPNTARSTPEWRVRRKTMSTNDIIYAGAGNKSGEFEHPATDIATVSALTYTLEA